MIPWGVFILAFSISALAGLAALLRSSTQLSKLRVSSSSLNSGLLGLAISLLWYTQYQDNLYFLIGVCLVAGLSGMTSMEFLFDFIKKNGINITLEKKDEKKDDEH
jgi:hypothetical protein